MTIARSSALFVILASLPAFGDPPSSVKGTYVEVRERLRADLPPARGGEVLPHRTTLLWHIESGSWNAQALGELSIAFEVRAREELDPSLRDPRVERGERRELERGGALQVTAHVDRRATPDEERALLSLAAFSAPELAREISAVRRGDIDVAVIGGRTLVRVASALEIAFDHHEEDGNGCTAVCARDPRPGRALAAHVEVESAHELLGSDSFALSDLRAAALAAASTSRRSDATPGDGVTEGDTSEGDASEGDASNVDASEENRREREGSQDRGAGSAREAAARSARAHALHPPAPYAPQSARDVLLGRFAL